MTYQKCPDCKKDMSPVPVQCRLESSEWYCRICHRSVQMDRETAVRLLDVKRQMEAQR